MAVRVAFAVACNKWQSKVWWSAFAEALVAADRDPDIEVVNSHTVGTASPDFTKCRLSSVSFYISERGLTDTNRNRETSELLGRADYIYWWDDDTVHPPGTLKRLLSLQHPFVSGVYYVKRPPFHPIAYYRNEDGTYRPVMGWRKGELLEVDSVGMGCALIHRSVYDAIKARHDVFFRDNYTVVVLPKGSEIRANRKQASVVASAVNSVVEGPRGTYYVQRVRRATQEELDEKLVHWPFYAMEYLRTEDHWFCELADNVGFKPLLDTSVNCGHVGDKMYGRDDHRRFAYLTAEPEPNGGAGDAEEEKE